MNIPVLTTQQMIEVDRLMIDVFGIELIQMMENAGHNLSVFTSRYLGNTLSHKNIGILCGRGNNGGGGMVSARHLHNHGADVHVIKLPGKLKSIPAKQWRILENLGLQHEPGYDLKQADIIIDALIGYGLKDDPLPEVKLWIEKINSSGKPVIALDAPTGLNTNTGSASKTLVRADATLTLALPKVGLLNETARPFVGELYLADISVPPGLYRKMGIDVGNIFEKDSLIKVKD